MHGVNVESAIWQFVRLPELLILSEHSWVVRVTHQAHAVEATKDALQLMRIVNRIVGEEVFIDRPPGRSVHAEVIVVVDAHLEVTKKVPAAFASNGVFFGGGFELATSPVGSLLGGRVEIGWLVEDAKVVIPQKRPFAAFSNEVGTGTRVGTVADQIAEANDALHFALLNVGQDRFEGGQVRVDVTNDGGSQGGS